MSWLKDAEQNGLRKISEQEQERIRQRLEEQRNFNNKKEASIKEARETNSAYVGILQPLLNELTAGGAEVKFNESSSDSFKEYNTSFGEKERSFILQFTPDLEDWMDGAHPFELAVHVTFEEVNIIHIVIKPVVHAHTAVVLVRTYQYPRWTNERDEEFFLQSPIDLQDMIGKLREEIIRTVEEGAETISRNRTQRLETEEKNKPFWKRGRGRK